MASHLVGLNQISTFITPVNGTSPIDANQVRGNDNTIKTAYNAHDLDPTLHVQDSLLAGRATAGVEGRKWMTTDTGAVRLWYDTGAAWEEVAYLPVTGGTFTGPVSFIGAAPQITLGPDVAHTVTFAVSAVDYWFTASNLAAAGPGLLPGFEFENPLFARAQFGVDALDGVHGLEIDANNTGDVNLRALTASGRFVFEDPITVWGVDSLFGAGTGAFTLQINGAAGTARGILFETAGVSRWGIVTSAAAEAGADAGSDFALTAYTDAGALIDTPITIARVAGGGFGMFRPVTMSLATDSPLRIVSSAAGVGPIARWSRTAATAYVWQQRLGTDGTFQWVDETRGAIAMSISPAGNATITGTLTVGGATFTSDAGANYGIGKHAVVGLIVRTGTGSSYDFGLYTPAAVLAIAIPTGSTQVNFGAGIAATLGIGAFGTSPPGAKPAVTGSRGGNVALASLLTTLAAAGFFTDSSTP